MILIPSEQKLTEAILQRAVAGYVQWWNKVVIPNLCLWHEMDVAVMTRARYLWEFEIKVSQADWNTDGEKDVPEGYWDRPRRNLTYVKRFWYVYAEGLTCPDWVPEERGLMEARVRESRSRKYSEVSLVPVRRATDRKVDKLKERHIRKFYEAAYYRFWKRQMAR